ncbi:MAG: hypothetical protein OEM84_15410, partial [Acidimicrobiia bacterium]|nr:hypothetical protein [Acidimicrobiia bacterium]
GGSCSGTGPTCNLTMTGPRTASHNFTLIPPPDRTLTISPVPVNGTITGNGINCGTGGGVCSLTYTNGTTVTLMASPDPSFLFLGWGGDCSGIGSCILTMNVDHTVTATFGP